MSRNIPESIRKAVAERSGNRCEYCRRLEGDSFIKFQVDHIISRKHRGNEVNRILERLDLIEAGLFP